MNKIVNFFFKYSKNFPNLYLFFMLILIKSGKFFFYFKNYNYSNIILHKNPEIKKNNFIG